MIRIKRGSIEELHNGEVLTPYCHIAEADKWKELEIHNFSREYITLNSFRTASGFNEIDSYTVYDTQNKTFLKAGGILIHVRGYKNEQQVKSRILCVIYEYGGKKYGIINSSYLSQYESYGTLLRQFLRVNGVALKDISYVEELYIHEAFKKNITYQLEDSLPEEQLRFSKEFLKGLQEELKKKIEEGVQYV